MCENANYFILMIVNYSDITNKFILRFGTQKYLIHYLTFCFYLEYKSMHKDVI